MTCVSSVVRMRGLFFFFSPWDRTGVFAMTCSAGTDFRYGKGTFLLIHHWVIVEYQKLDRFCFWTKIGNLRVLLLCLRFLYETRDQGPHRCLTSSSSSSPCYIISFYVRMLNLMQFAQYIKYGTWREVFRLQFAREMRKKAHQREKEGGREGERERDREREREIRRALSSRSYTSWKAICL